MRGRKKEKRVMNKGRDGRGNEKIEGGDEPSPTILMISKREFENESN